VSQDGAEGQGQPAASDETPAPQPPKRTEWREAPEAPAAIEPPEDAPNAAPSPVSAPQAAGAPGQVGPAGREQDEPTS